MRLKNNILKISYVAIVLAFVALEARSSFEIDALFLVNHLNGLIERNLIYFNASLYIFLITIICSNFKFSEDIDNVFSINTLLVTTFPIFSIIYIQYKIKFYELQKSIKCS